MSDWDSAKGRDGLSSEERRAKEKEQEAEWKRARESFREQRAADAAIEVRTLAEWASFNAQCTMHNAQFPESEECWDEECTMHNAQSAEPAREVELFPPFWHPGELAVMMGPSGVGKSRLAMQVAAAAAVNREEEEASGALSRVGSGQRTTPSSDAAAAGVGIHPSFVRRGAAEDLDTDPLAEANGNGVLYIDLERTGRQYGERYSGADGSLGNVELGLLGDVATPERYKRRRHKFLLSAVVEKLRDARYSIVIIDNLAWLVDGGSVEIRSLMKSFRRWVNQTGGSMLVLWHSSVYKPLVVQADTFDLADSVFAMKTSTMGENIRYIRSIRSARSLGRLGVLAFDMRREVVILKGEPGVDGFMPVGVSSEVDHYRDYASEMEIAQRLTSRAAAALGPPMSLSVPGRVRFLGIE